MRPRLLVPLAVLALVAVAGVLALRGRPEAADPPPAVAGHAAEIPALARSVSVSRTMPMPSAHERQLSAMLEEGAMPASPTMAEVLTDSDCTPDAQMISRCRNAVRLADGSRLVLRHPHDMRHVPCLAPGERVRLLPNNV